MQKLLLLCLFFLAASKSPPNFIVILTDDQDTRLGRTDYTDEGSMAAMPRTLQLLQNEGTRFNNFFVNTPICCPSRTELITGRYYHNIGAPTGSCMHINAEKNVFSNTSIFNLLQNGADYKTGVFGKLTNDQGKYFCFEKPHRSEGMTVVGAPCNYNNYYANQWFVKHENGSQGLVELPNEPSTYQTAQIGNRSLEWLSSVEPPFMLYIGPHAPHYPATPAPWYDNSPFEGIQAPRTKNYNVESADKHQMIRQNPAMDKGVMDTMDTHMRDRWTSLISVDEIVEAVVNKVNERGLDDNTYIMYTSDHGYHLGQYRVACSKEQPYEATIRVPMYIRGPGISKNVSIPALGGNVDITPTILELAGIEKPNVVDGKSLVPLLKEAAQPQEEEKPALMGWRDRFLLEYKSVGTYWSDHCNVWVKGKTFSGQYTSAPRSLNGSKDCTEESQPGSGNCWFVDSEASNTWRALRVMNETHNVVFAEFDPTWKFDSFESIQWFEYYDINNDEYQMDNLAKGMGKDALRQWHDETGLYFKCKGSSDSPSNCI